MLNRRFFNLNFVSCTSSLFELGSFLDSIEHDYISVFEVSVLQAIDFFLFLFRFLIQFDEFY